MGYYIIIHKDSLTQLWAATSGLALFLALVNGMYTGLCVSHLDLSFKIQHLVPHTVSCPSAMMTVSVLDSGCSTTSSPRVKTMWRRSQPTWMEQVE